MNCFNNKLAGILAIFLALSVTTVQANPAYREGGFEFSFLSQSIEGETIEFEGGAKAEIQSDVGFGFGLAYNYSNKLALRGDFSWNSARYDATRIIEDTDDTIDEADETEIYGGIMDTASFMFGGDYYFLDKAITPYIGGSLGWTFFDTNVPSGLPQGVCWWDPWYGYICSYSTPTYTTTEFTYGINLGLRADLSRNVYLRLGYYDRWVEFKKANDTSEFGSVRMDLGIKFH